MFYDRGRTDSFDVPAGFGLGYLYHGSVSGVGICVILLLNRKQKNQDDRSWFLCFNTNRFYIRFPHFWCFSMRVADIVSKMSPFFANSTFRHDYTS